MRRALADAAVGNHVLVGRNSFALVERTQLGHRLERAVLGDGLAPGNVPRARDVAAPQRTLVRIVWHVQAFAAIFLRAAHVDERLPSLQVRRDIVAKGADRLVVASWG